MGFDRIEINVVLYRFWVGVGKVGGKPKYHGREEGESTINYDV